MPLPKYYSDFNEANNYARLMHDLLRKHKLPPNLVNITICYEYVSGSNKELKQAMDNIFKGAESFSAEIAEALYKNYIWDDEKQTHEKLNDVLTKHFDDVLFSVNKVRSDASTSSKNLEIQSQQLGPESSKSNIKHIVNNIVAETDKLVNISEAFETELEKQKEELEVLKTELKQTKELAETDPLTNLKNRRAFEECMAKTCLEGLNKGEPISLLMLDIDFFKKVNDKYGHPIGDKVICFVAEILVKNLKGKDLAARIGGEEYAVLLPGTSLNNATALAENLREIIETSRLTISKTQEKLDQVTISIGVTSYKRGETTDSFSSRADKALYSSKNRGRNKVTALADEKN